MMQLQTSNISNICATLLYRLAGQGLMLVESRKLIKDVINLLCDGGCFTLDSVNKHLENIGWNKQMMDTVSFELIISLLESEFDYSVKTHILH